MLRRKRVLPCSEESLNPHNQSCPLPNNRGHNLPLISNPHTCPNNHRLALTVDPIQVLREEQDSSINTDPPSYSLSSRAT